MQKWNVRGVMRVGLFAIKEIPPGSELCFDYQMEMFDKKPVKASRDEYFVIAYCATSVISVGIHMIAAFERHQLKRHQLLS